MIQKLTTIVQRIDTTESTDPEVSKPRERLPKPEAAMFVELGSDTFELGGRSLDPMLRHPRLTDRLATLELPEKKPVVDDRPDRLTRPVYSFEDTERVRVRGDEEGNATISVTYANGRTETIQHDAEDGKFDLEVDGGVVDVRGNVAIRKISGSAEAEEVDIGRDVVVDQIDLGGGNDELVLVRSSRVGEIALGDGEDYFLNYGTAETVRGGDGDDRIINYGTALELHGEAGSDRIVGANGSRTAEIHGGAGDDDLRNHGAAGRIHGDEGNDEIVNYHDAGLISGGAGDDRIVSDEGWDGYQRRDTLPRAEEVRGDEGNDEIIVNRGYVDSVSGGEGTDSLSLRGSAADYAEDDGLVRHHILGETVGEIGDDVETTGYHNPLADVPTGDLQAYDRQDALELALRPDATTAQLEALVDVESGFGWSPDTVKALLAHPNAVDSMFERMARSERTPDQSLLLIAESDRTANRDIALALVQNPAAGPRVIEEAFSDNGDDVELARAVIDNPHASTGALSRAAFIHSGDTDLALKVAAHPNADTQTLDLLTSVHSADLAVATAIVDHPEASAEAIAGLGAIHGSDLAFARRVAAHPSASSEALDNVLAQHGTDAEILRSVATHPNASREAIETVLATEHAAEVPQHHGIWSRIKGAFSAQQQQHAEHAHAFREDLSKTFGLAGDVLSDTGHTIYDLFRHPGRLGEDFAHLRQDYTDAKWSAIETAGDAAALLIPGIPAAQAADWVLENLVEPAAGWVGDHLVAPASRFIWSHLVDPANSAVAGMLAKATGLDEAGIEAYFEAEEQGIYDFSKGFLEEGYTIAKGFVDLAAQPGEAIKNMTTLAHMAATNPHQLWDGIKASYEGQSPAEIAGRVGADVLSLFLGPEEILALGTEEAAARGAQASTELAKTVATSMEMREAELTNAVTRAEEALESTEVGTDAWRQARDDLAEANQNLLSERDQQIQTYNSMKDVAVGQRDFLEQRLQNPSLTAEERASLEQALEDTEGQLDYLEHEEVEALRSQAAHLDEAEGAYGVASRPAAEVSTLTRTALEELATKENVTITPFVKDGEVGFHIEGVRPGRANHVANGLRAALEDTMPEFEVSLGENVSMDALLQSLPEDAELLPAVESGNPRLGRGGARRESFRGIDDRGLEQLTDQQLLDWARHDLSPNERVLEQERLQQILNEAAEEQGLRVNSRRFRHPLKDASQALDRVITEEGARGTGTPAATAFSRDNATAAARVSATDAIQHVGEEILGDTGAGIRQRGAEWKQQNGSITPDAPVYGDYRNQLRRIDYPGAPENEVHAVGIGRDVLGASYYDGIAHASSYTDIVGDLDQIAERVGRERVVDIIKHYLSGATEAPNLQGLSASEAAQIREFTTIQIAESGREAASAARTGVPNQGVVQGALDSVAERGFHDTYVSGRDAHAIFAGQGGHGALRDFYDSLAAA